MVNNRIYIYFKNKHYTCKNCQDIMIAQRKQLNLKAFINVLVKTMDSVGCVAINAFEYANDTFAYPQNKILYTQKHKERNLRVCKTKFVDVQNYFEVTVCKV